MTSKAPKLLKANLILCLIAGAVSAYMVWHHYTLVNGEGGFGSFCSINETIDCDAVNASKYSELMGVPLATFSLVYFLFAALLSAIGALNTYSRRETLLLLLPLSAGSVLASLGTLSVTAFILKKFCLMCISIQALSLLTFILLCIALKDFVAGSSLTREISEANRKKLLTFAGTGLALFAVTHGLSAQLREELPFDVEQFVNAYRAEPVRDIPVDDSPRQGFKGDNPPVRLIEFADFECPACGHAARQMHRLVRLYDDKIQLVFKNFPLDSACNPEMTRSLHQHACLAAKAAYCAHKQGKFVDFYEKLYANQRAINRQSIDGWARELGLDVEALGQCIPAPETDAAIRRDVSEATKAGLSSTPTFFVNGRMVQGAIDEPKLKALLRELGQ